MAQPPYTSFEDRSSKTSNLAASDARSLRGSSTAAWTGALSADPILLPPLIEHLAHQQNPPAMPSYPSHYSTSTAGAASTANSSGASAYNGWDPRQTEATQMSRGHNLSGPPTIPINSGRSEMVHAGANLQGGREVTVPVKVMVPVNVDSLSDLKGFEDAICTIGINQANVDNYFRIIGKLPRPSDNATEPLTELRSTLFEAFRPKALSFLLGNAMVTSMRVNIQVKVQDGGRNGWMGVDVPIDLRLTKNSDSSEILRSIDLALSGSSEGLKLVSRESSVVNRYLTTFLTTREQLLNDKIQLVSQCNNGGLPGAELELDDDGQIVCRLVILRAGAL
ncbi:hypothetical protein QFC24_005707 [Naganishia onofrii]|uniref:Uncharacterized protein n=1 Tax=Naganishia onofrii TaxID=1851511 RepID=A0ACC2X7Z5_9TREE|nr:hypothetical protein QFC24_005707 [Naganishia onofrii]